MLTKHVTTNVGPSRLNITGDTCNLLCLTLGQCLDGMAEANVSLGGGVGGWGPAVRASQQVQAQILVLPLTSPTSWAGPSALALGSCP